MDFIEGQV